MIKRYSHLSKIEKAAIIALLREDEGELIERLKKNHSHNEVLSIIIPMAFENSLSELDCEFVTVLLSEGTKMGFYMPVTDSLVVLDLRIDDQKINILVGLPNSSVLQKTTIDFPMYWTRDIWSDCLMVLGAIKFRRELLTNLIRLVDFDVKDTLPN
jgi:hypothetical protein